MSRLELKHVAPYLPYGLKIFCKHVKESWINKETSIYTIVGLKGKDNCDLLLLSSVGVSMWYGSESLKECFDSSKPILRPLSDLQKLMYSFIYEDETDLQSISEWYGMDVESRMTSKYSYEFWQLLFENHFDVFGLIPNGLAVDINTLTK